VLIGHKRQSGLSQKPTACARWSRQGSDDRGHYLRSASLTKCIATATSVMKLVQEGKIRLNDPVTAYLPEFAKNGKSDITVRELLTHFSGLTEDLDSKLCGRARYRLPDGPWIRSPHFLRSRFLYSDINFETLGL